MMKPTISPISGATTMNTPIFTRPLATSEPNPALATAAPANPPISACEELVGRPQNQVIRSQTIAPMSPATMTHWSTMAVSTTPLPTVRATLTPKPKAATKLKNAAQTTACSGVSTRVDTTVAIELAASWKPLMKSKTSATKMMMATEVSNGWSSPSRHLENDALDHVGDVLAPVGHDLHRLVDLFPLDDFDGIARLVEHRGQAVAQQRVGDVLQAVHLDGVLVKARIHRAQALDRVVHRVRDGHDHFSHRPAGGRRFLDAVHHQPLGGGLDVIEHVVQTRGQVVDVLAVDRRDEGRIELLDDLVGDLVALVLDFLDRVRLGSRVAEVIDHLVEQRGGPDDVLGLLLEVVEEPNFLRDQVEH